MNDQTELRKASVPLIRSAHMEAQKRFSARSTEFNESLWLAAKKCDGNEDLLVAMVLSMRCHVVDLLSCVALVKGGMLTYNTTRTKEPCLSSTPNATNVKNSLVGRVNQS